MREIIESCNIRDSCPNHVWRPGLDGKLERFNLWTFQQSLTRLDKLNRDIFTLTFGKKNIPPMAMTLSKNLSGPSTSNIAKVCATMVMPHYQ